MKDRAGNESAGTVAAIQYDDVAPGPVAVTAAVHGTGTRIALDWSSYDEVANGGDIAQYTVYQADSAFTRASEGLALGTTGAGQKTFAVGNLTRNATKHYGVAAMDASGLSSPSILSIAAAPVDVVAPANPADLRFECGKSNLVLRWAVPADGDGDLAGYRLYFNGATNPAELGAGTLTHAQAGLSPATAYSVRVSSIDETGNESGGATGTGITWLVNPTNVVAVPYSGLVDLSWSAATPSAYVKQYRIYRSATNFSDVSGMAAAATATGTVGSVAGLQNDQTYYFAVVAENLSGGLDPQVTPVAAMPRPDAQGPTLAAATWEGSALTNGQTLAKPGTLRVAGTDRAGMGRVEFWLDGILMKTDSSGTNGVYGWLWNVGETEDGSHELAWGAYDTLGNATWATQTVRVALAVPSKVPVIQSPTQNALVNAARQTVSGTADPYATGVALSVNGEPAALATPTAAGTFSHAVTLAAGTNRLRAAAVNRAGQGASSAERIVVLDMSVPSAPNGVHAQSQESGRVQLTWIGMSGAPDYWVYRSATPFATTTAATRLNAARLTSPTYSDLPTADGTYYYRVQAENQAGTPSELSAQVEGRSDRTAPYAQAVTYASDGPVNAAESRFGRGTVQVQIQVSEALQAAPFYSLNPEGGSPIVLKLTSVSTNALLYRGSFTVSEGLCGTAQGTFSARDEAGNRGTEVKSGATIMLDGCGPTLRVLAVSPAAP
ncbi:MAG TPA: hypothetical protein PK388_08915, partial [Kiritimatiellia bacterium]|nr:hypothetical protein [Kiritimatiellia bacterium]